MVTAITNNPGLVAGQILDWSGCITFLGKKTTGVITRGDLLVPDTGTSPDSWKQSPAATGDITGPFAVCMKTTTSAATEISVAMGGIIALTADGTIEIGKKVQAASATAGQVIVHTATSPSATPTGTQVTSVGLDEARVVGICLGFADNYNTKTPTAPVDGDIAAILMRRV